MARLRLVFMGTPSFAVPALIRLAESGHEIAAVYTAPPKPAGRGQRETLSPVHAQALRLGLTAQTPTSLKSDDAQARFRAYRPDIAVVAAYGLLLPPAILDAPPLGCLNIHPSLLPRWRGAAPIQRAVMAGDEETGIVIMKMDAGLDTGAMLLTERHPILPRMTAGALHDRLAAAAAPLLLQAVEGWAAGALHPEPQPEYGVTYAAKIQKIECRIDWTWPAFQALHHILGLSPSPKAAFFHEGERIQVLDAELASLASTAAPGTVLDEALRVQCGNGAIRLLQLQRSGKNPMPASAWLQGFPIAKGARFS